MELTFAIVALVFGIFGFIGFVYATSATQKLAELEADLQSLREELAKLSEGREPGSSSA
jgi:uncharacterized membrane-anchored protein YhcB (DUF1043 family)